MCALSVCLDSANWLSTLRSVLFVVRLDDFPMPLSHRWLQSLVEFSQCIIFNCPLTGTLIWSIDTLSSVALIALRATMQAYEVITRMFQFFPFFPSSFLTLLLLKHTALPPTHTQWHLPGATRLPWLCLESLGTSLHYRPSTGPSSPTWPSSFTPGWVQGLG